MRYGKDQKQATRQRILEAAGRRFKQDGIDGAGVAAVMSDAGLTNGAFYGHFSSKEDLVANVLADQLRAQRQSLDAQPSDRAGLEAFVRSYLSPQHRDQCADGCPSAALLDEIARRPAATRQVFTDELMGVIDDIAVAPGPDRRRGCSDGRAHGLRADGRHPAARQGTDRPRPVRSAPRPGRGDGPEDARQPGMTASQHTPQPGNDDCSQAGLPRSSYSSWTSSIAMRTGPAPARARNALHRPRPIAPGSGAHGSAPPAATPPPGPNAEGQGVAPAPRGRPARGGR